MGEAPDLNGAADIIDRIRNRAGLGKLPQSTRSSKEALLQAYMDERRMELAFEGQRWYDLKRTNRLDLFTSLNGRNYLMYYPVPQSERDLAGAENYPQNDGY